MKLVVRSNWVRCARLCASDLWHSVGGSLGTWLCVMLLAGVACGQDFARIDPVSLSRFTSDELLNIYRNGVAVRPSNGWIKGMALVRPGSAFSALLSRGSRVAWQGKRFDDDGVVNRFFGVEVVRAEVACGASWIDGGPTLVLDYRRTSRAYRKYRDEVRQVLPGFYLGVMIDQEQRPPRIVRYFVLEG